MSASAMLTSWFVRRSRRSASGTICAICTLRASSVRPARMRSTTWVTSAVKPVVVLPDLGEKFRLFLGDEFHAVEVVSELIELAERCIEHPVVLKQKRGRDAVELARRIVLDLVIGGDLALQPDQLVGLIVDPAQHLQARRRRARSAGRRSTETRSAAWSGRAPAAAQPSRPASS